MKQSEILAVAFGLLGAGVNAVAAELSCELARDDLGLEAGEGPYWSEFVLIEGEDGYGSASGLGPEGQQRSFPHCLLVMTPNCVEVKIESSAGYAASDVALCRLFQPPASPGKMLVTCDAWKGVLSGDIPSGSFRHWRALYDCSSG